ncbi:MAG: hypothetical protein P8141_12730 [Gammaproteobacteria bacterium]
MLKPRATTEICNSRCAVTLVRAAWGLPISRANAMPAASACGGDNTPARQAHPTPNNKATANLDEDTAHIAG